MIVVILRVSKGPSRALRRIEGSGVILEAGVGVLAGTVEWCTDGATQLYRTGEARERSQRGVFDVAVRCRDNDMEVISIATLVRCGTASDRGAPEDAFDVNRGRWVVAASAWVHRWVPFVKDVECVTAKDVVAELLTLNGVVGLQVVAG